MALLVKSSISLLARTILPMLCLLGMLAETRVVAQSRESDLKAAFVFNFAQFVEWPSEAFASTNSPFVIGILGNSNPFGKTLDELVAKEKTGGHPMEVRLFRSIEEVKQCHILFITSSEAPRLREIFAWLDNRPILTVGDIDEFIPRGGMIRLYTASNKIRIRISLEAAKRAKLNVSSKLLRLADVVDKQSLDR